MTDAQCVAIMVSVMRSEMCLEVQMIRLNNGFADGIRTLEEDIKDAKALLIKIKNAPLDNSL